MLLPSVEESGRRITWRYIYLPDSFIPLVSFSSQFPFEFLSPPPLESIFCHGLTEEDNHGKGTHPQTPDEGYLHCEVSASALRGVYDAIKASLRLRRFTFLLFHLLCRNVNMLFHLSRNSTVYRLKYLYTHMLFGQNKFNLMYISDAAKTS